MQCLAIVISIISLVVAGFSVLYNRSQSQAAQKQADEAERTRLGAEAASKHQDDESRIRARRCLLDLINELKYNDGILKNTAPVSIHTALADEAWRVLLDSPVHLPDHLHSRIAELYRELSIVRKGPETWTRGQLAYGDPTVAARSASLSKAKEILPAILAEVEVQFQTEYREYAS